ncbi:hypothetical protein GCM10027447_00910 [Glycomyces halotolerans]
MSIQSKLTAARRGTALAGGAFAMTLALAACGGGASPEGAVEDFLDNGVEDLVNALVDGDTDRAAELGEKHLCGDVADEINSQTEEIAAMTDDERAQMREMMGEELIPEDWSYELGETTEDGDTATVEVEMTENGETSSETFDLVKEDDEWKICGDFMG